MQYGNEVASIEQEINKLLKKKKGLIKEIERLEKEEKAVEKEYNNYSNIWNEYKNTMQTERLNLLNKFKTQVSTRFEPNWMKWDCICVYHWFKYLITYKLNNNETDVDTDSDEKCATYGQVLSTPNGNENEKNEIDWDLILNNLQSCQFALVSCDKEDLKEIGFKSEISRNFLMKEIEALILKYPDKRSRNKKINTCKICFENEIGTVIVPCGHACLCKECSQKYDQSNGCPLCRKDINMLIDMFIS